MCDSDTLKVWNGMTFASGKYGWLNIGNGAKLWVDTTNPDSIRVEIYRQPDGADYTANFIKPSDPQITMTLTLPKSIAFWLKDIIGKQPYNENSEKAYVELKRAVDNGIVKGR